MNYFRRNGSAGIIQTTGELNMTKFRADEEIHRYVDLEDDDGTTTRARVDEIVLEPFVGPST
jgi:hypothetical protein